jgi:hypothetical protein
MRTVWLLPIASTGASARADAAVASLADVPAAAGRLVVPDWRAHVA